MSTQQPAAETEAPVQPNLGTSHTTPPSFPGRAPLTPPVLSDHKESASVSGQHTHTFKYNKEELLLVVILYNY